MMCSSSESAYQCTLIPILNITSMFYMESYPVMHDVYLMKLSTIYQVSTK